MTTTPESGWVMSDEQILSFAAHAANRISASNYEGRVLHAVRMALEAAHPEDRTPPAAEPSSITEATAWLINFTVQGQPCRTVALHNAVGDYRDLDPNAASTPLYTTPMQSGAQEALREALIEIHGIATSRDIVNHNRIAVICQRALSTTQAKAGEAG